MKIILSLPTIFLLSTQTTVLEAFCSKPLVCENNGTCETGPKDMEQILGVDEVGLITPEIDGMHCECPGENPTSKYGFTGVQCDTVFERCQDGSVCFNSGYCVADSTNINKFHCACLADDEYAVNGIFAGVTCENPATSFCSTNDEWYALTSSRWFCTNRGKCVDNEDDVTKKCECESGYFGLHCEYDQNEICSLQCENGGVCKSGAKDYKSLMQAGLNLNEFVGGNNIEGEFCVCPKGYDGVRCELENHTKCGAGICFNGGMCMEEVDFKGDVSEYYCDCDCTEIAGKYCQHNEGVSMCPYPEDHNPSAYYCANGGFCAMETHLPCDCEVGYTGNHCEVKEEIKKTDVIETCDKKCQNGGNCFFGEHPLEDGKLKKETMDDKLSFLDDNQHCRCPDGYIGLNCEQRYQKCHSGEHFCLNGSDCVEDNDEFTCDCNAAATKLISYAGHYCQHAATSFCSKTGGKSFCTNHGTCRGEVGEGQDHVGCDCKEGWTGDYCEYELTEMRTDGIATRAFIGFLAALFGLLSIGSLYICLRNRDVPRTDYDAAYTSNNDLTQLNPYGGNIHEEDDDNEEYELKEVTII